MLVQQGCLGGLGMAISLKEYAAQKNISYEAVRRQVVRYKEELGDHVIRDGKQQLLDEEAVAFLDLKRQKNPVVIIQQSKEEQIEQLEEQVKQLLIKTASQADRISELAQWKADHALVIAEAAQQQLMLDDKNKEIEILEGFIRDAKAEIEALNEEKRAEAAAAQQAREELDRIRSASFWQRLRGWK